jgi:alkanesulfonate monooxygenase SsuD/methylene tetrahydromethanopterin reductase-like flavin-dependent oxidoreductase (luciferase family)
MPTTKINFGLTLPNRGVLFGVETMSDLLTFGEKAEETGLFKSLWLGDSLFAKRRPESIVLLSALAARTQNLRLAVGCMASFPVRHPALLAAQWASLDMLAGPNRALLAVCIGGRYGGGDWEMENQVFNVEQKSRVSRMEEGIEIVRKLFTEEVVSYEGKYYKLENARLEPRPVTKPAPPIWIAANPRPINGDSSTIERSLRRTARLADGWMTTWLSVDSFRERWGALTEAIKAEGRDPATFDNSLYYNVNINEDREAAAEESKKFLDIYYERDHSREDVDLWVAYGSPQDVINRIQEFIDAGAKEITFRITSWDQERQFQRLVNEVLPAFVS